MKLISENYDFDRKFEICVENFEDCDLYVNTTGYAYLKFFDTGKIRVYVPNSAGYIKVKGKKINIKRKIFKAVYPKIDISKKIVVSFGKNFNILHLVALTKNEFINIKKHNKTVVKNQNNGQIWVQ